MSTTTPSSGAELERLRAIFDAYGGDPLRWPEDERDAALALLARSGDARRLHEDALRLDAALDLLPAAAPSPGLEDRIVAAARGDGAVPRRPAHRRAGARRAGGAPRLVRIGVLGAVPLAAAAALALWLGLGGRAGRDLARQPATAARSAPVADIALADLGSYSVPGDALLEVPVLEDVYDSEPLRGCSDGELGCLQLEPLPFEPLSRDDAPVKEVRALS